MRLASGRIAAAADIKGHPMITSPHYTLADVPFTAVWPSDNSGGIPLLDINLQAIALEQPITLWGSTKRKARHSGTIIFYCDDYRFLKVWNDPSVVPNTGCVWSTPVNSANAACDSLSRLR